jgi:chromosome partitioning protein
VSVITIATSKGGAGKTTVAEVILGELAARGMKVAAIDADYNHTLSDWVKTFASYPIEVRAEVDETKILPLVAELEEANDLVVIDTAGAAMQATVFAIGCADLVLIPVQLSSADVVEALKTAKLVKSASDMTRRAIPARVVLTDYQPATNIATHTEGELTRYGLELLRAKLHRLVAFKEMTFSGDVPRTGIAGVQVAALIEELMTLGAVPRETMKLAS